MSPLDAAIQVRSLRMQLDVLEARLRKAPSPDRHTLGDLWGILKDETPITDEEIEAVKYKCPSEDVW